MDTLKTQHNGIDITYEEKPNVWKFELRGRERTAESLAKAKEIISKPDPKEKSPFTRIKAYSDGHYGDEKFPVVEVTSIAEGSQRSAATYFWTVQSGTRSKVRGSELFPVGLKNNDALVKELGELDEQKAILTSKYEQTKEKLSCMDNIK